MESKDLINENEVTAIPVVPTNVVATASGPISIDLSWDTVNDANGYRVYRSETSDGNYAQIADTTSLNFVDTFLVPNKEYYYQVSAYNDEGESQKSNFVLAKTDVVGPPSNLMIGEIADTSISLSWTAPQNYDSFNVYRSETSDGVFALIGNVNDTSYVDTGLKQNTAYYYRVETVLNGVTSEQSDVVNGTTKESAIVLLPPSDVRAIKLDCSSVEVRWNLVDGANRYSIYRSTSLNGPYVLVGNSYGFNYYDEKLLQDTTYYYYVVSLNAGLVSGRSEVVSNTTYQTCQDNCFNTRCNIIVRNGNVYECCCLRKIRCKYCN